MISDEKQETATFVRYFKYLTSQKVRLFRKQGSNMWTRQADDTVIDEDGKVVYFGLERFVRDICLGDCCFVCGAQPGTVPFNDEHVIPKWLLRRYDLFKRKINLPNGTTLRYDRYTVPCCEACNPMMGRVIEEPMRQIIEGDFDAVSVHREKHGILKFYVWVGLIFLKTHLKDRKLRAHLDPRRGTAPIAENLQYDWKGLHYLHTLVRCFATDAGIHTSALGSFVIIRLQPAPAGEAFDFGDLYAAQSIMLRMGDFAFLAAFNDGGCAQLFLKQKLDRITGPVSDVQLRELATDLAFLNLHLKEHPILESSFGLKEERHVISGTLVLPELEALDYAVRGNIMLYLFRDRLKTMKSYRFSEAEIENMMREGRLTFLFDDKDGSFITNSNATPPVTNPE
jgi:hypothetical protein